jgi:hypothetical protein
MLALIFRYVAAGNQLFLRRKYLEYDGFYGNKAEEAKGHE